MEKKKKMREQAMEMRKANFQRGRGGGGHGRGGWVGRGNYNNGGNWNMPDNSWNMDPNEMHRQETLEAARIEQMRQRVGVSLLIMVF